MKVLSIFISLVAGTSIAIAQIRPACNDGQSTISGLQAGVNYNINQGGSPCKSTLYGFASGSNITSGLFNSFIGIFSGYNTTTGSSNIMIGTNAGYNNTSGNANFFLGDNSGFNTTTGGYNVFLGANAGQTNSVGGNNVLIGFESNVGSGGLVNATAIGFRALVSQSNSLVLGNGANVGVGTSAPTAKLHLVSASANSSGLRLENLTSNSPSIGNASKFLTVNANGDVVLANVTSGGREAIAESFWEKKSGIIQSTQSNGVVIGSDISRLPGNYNLYVSKGILTEKVKVAVKNTDEWSDKVFAKDYQLKSLTEVEQHIQQHGHLPGLPSAEDMVSQGNDLQKTDAKLLEKIEELTLYLIEMKKQHEQQQQEIEQLKKQVKQLTKP